LRAAARRLKMKHEIGIIVVDYIQKMRGVGGTREQEIGSIARGLKDLAKELEVPVIALAQLSRAVEVRGGSKRPQLSDLRESGEIEQEADLVIFPYRPEYYDILEDGDGNSLAGIAELIFGKNRHGRCVPVMAGFDDIYALFRDLDEKPSSQFPASNALPASATNNRNDPPF